LINRGMEHYLLKHSDRWNWKFRYSKRLPFTQTTDGLS